MEELLGLLFWGFIMFASIASKKKKAQQKAQKKATAKRKEPPAPWEGASSPAQPVRQTTASKPVQKTGTEWDKLLQNATGDVADVIRSAVQAASQGKKTPARPAPQQTIMPMTQTMPASPLGERAPIAPTVHTHLDPNCDTHNVPGSLGAVSDEGFDPCHEEQFSERRASVTVTERPGLQLDLSGKALTQAFIMQEVLTRPCDRRPRGCAR
ncbi:MAG: hypothetical protein IKK21_09400 [Clostridia bacterium]|nr:hypothetical protein [Clostridia bacterium]